VTVAGLTPRLRELGRLRMGDSEPVKGKKGRRPVKLTEWRLTSSNREAIETAAKLWGGEAHEWEAAPGEQQQWEVHTDASELNVLVPFPQDLKERQRYELYTGGGRTRACDGQEELLSGGPCLCEPDQRECKLTTHLLVMLPELPGVGVWRLTTTGQIAARELLGSMLFLRQIHARSFFATASLAIEQQSSKSPGHPEYQFVVPVLRLPYSLAEAGLVSGRPALPAGVDPETGEILSPAAPPAVASTDSKAAGVVTKGEQPPAVPGNERGIGTPASSPAGDTPSATEAKPEETEVAETWSGGEGGDADHPSARVPLRPSSRPCLHLKGTRSHQRESDGAWIEICIECSRPIETVTGSAV
jgi:hypothetical protein